MTTLFHYTCDHGHGTLGPENTLVPAIEMIGPFRDAPWTAQFVWLTDLSFPNRKGLGLTSEILNCDRTSHRYRVVDTSRCVWWPQMAQRLDPSTCAQVENVDGAMPTHWWISSYHVPVVYDPLVKP